MMCINECELKVWGLTVVLKSASSKKALPLTEWLSDFEFMPLPLPKFQGVIKLIIALQNPAHYPALIHKILEQIANNQSTIKWMEKCYEISGIEAHTDSLYILELPFFPSQPLPPTLGRAIHAQFFQWLSSADPILTESLHGKQALPVTLGIKPSILKNHLSLQITVLQGNLLAPLLWGISKDIGKTITFTGIPCQISNSLHIRASTNFEKLLKTLPPPAFIELEFLSPTSFKQKDKIQPFPLPELVFNSLCQKWNTFAPEKYQLPATEWHSYTAAYDLQTYAMKMKAPAEIGCQGIVRYEFSNPEEIKIATILANFAPYSGVGRKTTMGMGRTKIVPYTSDTIQN